MKKFVTILLIFFTIGGACLLGGCSKKQTLQDRGYTVCVTFDCNGGLIGTRAERFWWVKPNSLLIEPGDKVNGAGNVSAPEKTGYKLIGWFSGAKDDAGNITFDKPWNFKTDRATQSVTLYAKWEKMSSFVVNFYETVTNDSGITEDIPKTTTYYVPDGGELKLIAQPEWKGHTNIGVYTNEECTLVANFPLTHSGGNDNKQIQLYTKWIDGDFKLVRTLNDISVISNTTNYYLMNDIDFSGGTWQSPARYSGKFYGNGFSLKNINLTITQKSEENFGLFGTLNSMSQIKDLNIVANVIVNIGRKMPLGTYSGLLAGEAAKNATITNVNLSGSIKVIIDGFEIGENNIVKKLIGKDNGAIITNCVYDSVIATITKKQ